MAAQSWENDSQDLLLITYDVAKLLENRMLQAKKINIAIRHSSCRETTNLFSLYELNFIVGLF